MIERHYSIAERYEKGLFLTGMERVYDDSRYADDGKKIAILNISTDPGKESIYIRTKEIEAVFTVRDLISIKTTGIHPETGLEKTTFFKMSITDVPYVGRSVLGIPVNNQYTDEILAAWDSRTTNICYLKPNDASHDGVNCLHESCQSCYQPIPDESYKRGNRCSNCYADRKHACYKCGVVEDSYRTWTKTNYGVYICNSCQLDAFYNVSVCEGICGQALLNESMVRPENWFSEKHRESWEIWRNNMGVASGPISRFREYTIDDWPFGDCDENGNYGEGYYCDYCRQQLIYMMSSQGNGNRSINSYSYNPNPVFFDRSGELGTDEISDFIPKKHNELYMGMELEIEARNRDLDIDAEARKLNRGPIGKYVYIKDDGSLNHGFEIVSYPMSFDFWMKNFPWEEINGLRGKFSSHDSGSCGGHIHMSRDAFGQFHLYKFVRFHYDNYKMVQVIAQRVGNSYAYWKTISNEELKEIAKVKHSDRDRYHAVNLAVYSKNTIELRYFRGNMRPDRLKKNLQFVHAVYMYTRDNPLKELSWDGFKRHVDRNKFLYPELLAFMDETKDKLVISRREERDEVEPVWEPFPTSDYDDVRQDYTPVRSYVQAQADRQLDVLYRPTDAAYPAYTDEYWHEMDLSWASLTEWEWEGRPPDIARMISHCRNRNCGTCNNTNGFVDTILIRRALGGLIQ
jgi:hypothetical protein